MPFSLLQLHVNAPECAGHKWPSRSRHTALAAGFLLSTRIQPRAEFGAFIYRPHTILPGVARSRIPGPVDAHVLLRKRSALPVPNGWVAAVRLHNDRGCHHEYCFLLLSTCFVRQRPRRRPPCVPLRTSYFSHLQLLRIKPTFPRSRCFIMLISIS